MLNYEMKVKKDASEDDEGTVESDKERRKKAKTDTRQAMAPKYQPTRMMFVMKH